MGNQIIDIMKIMHFTSMFWLLMLPVAMMAIDVITGLTNAWVHKDFQSAKMRSGLAKKGGEMVGILIGILFTYGMGVPDLIINFISLYIILMELMSIMENLDRLGVPLPKALKDVINNVGTTIQTAEYTELLEKTKKMEAALELYEKMESTMKESQDDGK